MLRGVSYRVLQGSHVLLASCVRTCSWSWVPFVLPGQSASILMEQPLTVGLGFSSLPPKLVTQIVIGKYVDLSDLLAANLVHSEPEPQLLLDGWLMLTMCPKTALANWGSGKFNRGITYFCSGLNHLFLTMVERPYPLWAADSTHLQYWSKGLQHYTRVKCTTRTLHAVSTQCPRSVHAPYMQTHENVCNCTHVISCGRHDIASKITRSCSTGTH